MWRLAKQNDDELIVAMCLELNREDPGSKPVPAEHTRRTLLEIKKNPVRGKALVLEFEGAVVGYSFLMAFWSNELGGEICYIDELYVAPLARGRGLSTQLLNELTSRTGKFWRADCVALDLEVTPDNDRARKLYSSLGFKVWKNTMMRLRFS
jgi:ribosomal protein S18 acetylase RimI-like enzyme